MPSSISWLDSTPEEQRAAREIIALFSQQESRDELGIGQIRDAFSDILFPGTSTLHTRARYFLFIPWCYTHGKARNKSGAEVRRRGREQERELIRALQKANLGDSVGLIGGRVGPDVKNLPSTLYWSGLRRYNIMLRDIGAEDLGGLPTASEDGATELVERANSDWRGGIPSPIGSFPEEVSGGFDLTRDEADWLAERISTETKGSVLAHLIDRRVRLAKDTAFPWDAVDIEAFATLKQAATFSWVMHGAALMYNLVVAEAYESDANRAPRDPGSEEFRARLQSWWAEFDDWALPTWDRAAMWKMAYNQNPNIAAGARAFVEAWTAAVSERPRGKLADNKSLRSLVIAREQRKGKQSRLANPKMLTTWGGSSGAGQLQYRWPNIKTLVNDIHQGRNRVAST